MDAPIELSLARPPTPPEITEPRDDEGPSPPGISETPQPRIEHRQGPSQDRRSDTPRGLPSPPRSSPQRSVGRDEGTRSSGRTAPPRPATKPGVCADGGVPRGLRGTSSEHGRRRGPGSGADPPPRHPEALGRGGGEERLHGGAPPGLPEHRRSPALLPPGPAANGGQSSPRRQGRGFGYRVREVLVVDPGDR